MSRLFAVGPSGEPVDPYSTVTFETRSSQITNTDGSVVFEAKAVEAPSSWSQLALDILASKYLRKTGVPSEDGLPDGAKLFSKGAERVTGPETSLKQAVFRLARTWRDEGVKHRFFRSEKDADAFEDEVTFLLLHQMASPNSPQWFNTGLNHVHGITGPSQGHYYVDKFGQVRVSKDAYSRPQPHACFIQSVKDDLLAAGGIMDLWMKEARLFKYGSGTGTNFSEIRGAGEPLTGGGASSGLMSFLKIGDRAAGAIKSGGTTRRAAKMVLLDVDHPDIEAFVRWKSDEERKVAALVAAGFSADFEGEAYQTVSGQNSNNTVRVTDRFMRAVEEDVDWSLIRRTDGAVAKTIPARKLWNEIVQAAWTCADPGLQFDTTINEWHTCPASGRINASNPCSEYLFLDNTACNLASLNLLRFYDAERSRFRVDEFRHAVRLMLITLDVSNSMAQFPSRIVAERTSQFRTVGLGFANLGSLIMQMGLPYDSDKALAVSGALSAILGGEAYFASALLARHCGPFPAFQDNREPMLRVIRNHRAAAYDAGTYDGLSIPPAGLSAQHCPPYLLQAAREAWDRALSFGERFGFRNAQVSAVAPTGTIGLLMDCDTMGVEPEFALVKHKQLAGGGTIRIVNRSVEAALKTLDYDEEARARILRHVEKNETVEHAPELRGEHLAVFDTANRSGSGSRVLSMEGHLRMLGATQPFISGAISKTINLPSEATVEDVSDAFETAWRMGLKAVSLYRDGSKLSQPLTTKAVSKAGDKIEVACVTCGTGPGEEATCSIDRYRRVPLELQQRRQWVLFNAQKVPLQVCGAHASSTEPRTWSSFGETRLALSHVKEAVGIGFVLTRDDPVCAIDIDHCLDDEGKAPWWVEELLSTLNGYVERSPSGSGLHVLFKAAVPPDFRGGRRLFMASDQTEHAIEVYHEARYLTVTGDVWNGSGSNLTDRTAEFRQILEFSRSERAQPQPRGDAKGFKVNGHAMAALFERLGLDLRGETRLQTCCPFHDDHHSPSLSIDFEKGYFCHSPKCNSGGGARALREKIASFSDQELLQVSTRTGKDVHALQQLRDELKAQTTE